MPRKNKESSYYDKGGISLVDIWRAKLTLEEYRGLCKGNALKYIFRAGSKAKNTTVKDLRKAKDYIDNLIETYENSEYLSN